MEQRDVASESSRQTEIIRNFGIPKKHFAEPFLCIQSLRGMKGARDMKQKIGAGGLMWKI